VSADIEQLYQRSYRRLVLQLAAVTANVGDAEEVVQEAFVRALERAPEVTAMANPEGWLRVVALNLARSRWRRVARLFEFLPLLRVAVPGHDGPNDEELTVLAALRRLPKVQREALALFYLADMTLHQIAKYQRVSDGTVKARLSRGRAALRTLLDEKEAHTRV
jgi:RNA polymerase sigma factor (sigma-70 family)